MLSASELLKHDAQAIYKAIHGDAPACDIIGEFPLLPEEPEAWEAASAMDTNIIRLFAQRVAEYNQLAENSIRQEAEFVQNCFLIIRPDMPNLKESVRLALPVLLRLVFERHKRVQIWPETAPNADAETIALLDNWCLIVLEALEDYVRQGEKIDRRDLIAKRIDSVKLRDAVDALIIAYVRNQRPTEYLIVRHDTLPPSPI
jgi:hypothetical protein